MRVLVLLLLGAICAPSWSAEAASTAPPNPTFPAFNVTVAQPLDESGELALNGTLNHTGEVFIAVAADDQLLADASHPIFKAWKAAGRSAELHIYQRGGHGFGMNPTHGSADHWIDEFYWWLQSTGVLTPR